MRKFEVPYNYDMALIDRLADKMDIYAPQLEWVYLPCWEEDGHNTRMEYDQYRQFRPKDRAEYEQHIRRLQGLGVGLNVLFQRIGGEQVSLDTIKYYESLGVRSFTTDSDALASRIKGYSSDIVTVASVIKLLEFEEYFTTDLSMYDYSVLQFSFERGLEAVQALPTDLNYMLIVNNFGCVYNCKKCLDHWRTGETMCDGIRNAVDGEHYKCGIYPRELVYFDDHIQCYKLAGRELSTDALMSYVDFYLDPQKSDFFRRKRALLSTACTDGTIAMHTPVH